MREYNKLVRLGIPDIIEENGSKPCYNVIEQAVLIKALKAKIVEEANEVNEASAKDELIEELADISEAIESLMKLIDLADHDLETVKKAKRIKRGGFIKTDSTGTQVGIYLKGVVDERK